MPGVSRRVTVFRTSAGVCDASNLVTSIGQQTPGKSSKSPPCEEGSPKLLKMAKRFWSVDAEHVARGLSLFLAVAGNKSIHFSSAITVYLQIRVYLIMWKLSVVGSGPIRIPGKSFSKRYLALTIRTKKARCWLHLMNVVLPVEYCPISITNGFPSKSGSSSIGECISWYLYSLVLKETEWN